MEAAMPINLRNSQTEALVRELARRRGVGLTEAVHEAVEGELARDRRKVSLWESTADLRARLASYPLTGQVADKQFFDSLSGQDDE
jgi:antitoxin VapB